MISAGLLSFAGITPPRKAIWSKALLSIKKVGKQEGIATCFHNLGFLAIRIGNFPVASDYLEQALALCRVIGDLPGVSRYFERTLI